MKDRQQHLVDTTQALGESYGLWKTYEDDKEKQKLEFFGLATEMVREKGLARKVVDQEALDEDTALTRVRQMYPRWVVKQIHEKIEFKDRTVYTALIEENPQYKPFTFENPEDGMTYSRQISKGADWLDDEWLQEDDPELYTRVTYELPWGERVMVPMGELADEDVAKLTKYIFEGRPKVSLAPPKKTKEG